VLAIVKSTEGPQLTGQVVDVEPSEVHIGLKVRATFRKLREEGKAGVIHYGYKFTPSDLPYGMPPGSTGKDSAPAHVHAGSGGARA
jgi:hypothetical protein